MDNSNILANLDDISIQLSDIIEKKESEVNELYLELAKKSQQGLVPEDLKNNVLDEVKCLERNINSINNSVKKLFIMKDELIARLKDVEKSLNKKWYRRNPPSNTLIDLEEKEIEHFAQGINIFKVLLILFVGSFAGVIIELLWCFVTNGYFESRTGVVYGQFNILYGVGATLLSIELFKFRNRGAWLSFLGGFVMGSVVEYLCSWGMEYFLGTKSWDYSNLPFNLNGRICLLYSIFWGFLGIIWIKDIYPRMSKLILKIPNSIGKILTIVLTVFLTINGIISAFAVLRWSERNHGIIASNSLERYFDDRFPDERMKEIYANMTFTK